MQMKKLLLAAGVVGGFSGMSGTVAMAQATLTQTVTVSILEATVISLSSEAEMTFEQTVSPGAQTNVAASPASYIVTGSDRSFSIDTSGTSTALVLAGDSPLANDDTRMPFAVTVSADTGTIIKGSATFTVDGAITVAAGQPAGDYRGDLVVTVAYE